MTKRIKHNDLTHYFMADHKDLPRAYLRKCEKFFQSLQDRLITKKDAAFLFKHQAPSLKHTNLKEKYASLEPEAPSSKHQAASATKKT